MFSACGGRTARVSVNTTSVARASVPGASSSAASIQNADLEGLASYYAEPYHGRRTANGEVFDTYQAMTAAHRTLPFNTVVLVTNKNNGETVEVRINDRGPFIDGRVIDLSLIAAQRIQMVRSGVVPVKLQVLKEGDGARIPVNGSQTEPGMYAVQVGAFENLRSAEELKSRLARKYSDVSIQTFSGRSTVYRVRIGREPDLLSAEKLASQLRKEDLSTFVVRVN